ncbi:Protein of unknown function [Pyronema omphalodes CBS 100304]|uniref:Uncharacterized protein n=1 Tax=Pyronema omphalodes (strain CBS 100304) TaxID=1076935 RepID=U4L1K9_PYROM|nr:Protein of unknown function [Pyronema omphalodes CBS 100304]
MSAKRDPRAPTTLPPEIKKELETEQDPILVEMKKERLDLKEALRKEFTFIKDAPDELRKRNDRITSQIAARKKKLAAKALDNFCREWFDAVDHTEIQQ